MMILDEIHQHALDVLPNEACGLVVAYGRHHRIIPADNLAADPRCTFELDPEAWLRVRDGEEVIGIYHSHPDGDPTPSVADLTSCEISGYPWYIVGAQTRRVHVMQPCGYRAPYLQRPYLWGIHDCWSLARDWYQWEWGVEIPDFERIPRFWDKGIDLFRDNLEAAGFVEVDSNETLLVGDAFLISVESKVPNHIAIWLGDGKILHHAHGRLSTRDPWGGYWASHFTTRIRHKSKIGIT